MEKFKEMVQWQHHALPPVMIGNQLITLRSQALSVRMPFGGFIWNRPTGVTVEHNGQVEHLPIQDVTRTALLAFTLTTLCIALLSRLVSLRLRH